MKRYFFIFITVIFSISCAGNDKKSSTTSNLTWAYQLQNADPDQLATAGFKIVVMDYSRDGSEENSYTREEISLIKNHGVKPVAYLSIGEAEDYRFYWETTWSTNPPSWLGPENPEWKGNYAVKYWDPSWQSIIYSYIDRIIQQGFSGIYLDKIDEFEFWSERDQYDETFTAAKMIDFISAISTYAREKAGEGFLVIPQNGEKILKYDDGKLIEKIDGWAAEDLFFNGTEKWSGSDQKWILENRIYFLQKLISHGKFVLSIDYVDDGNGYEGKNLYRIKEYRSIALKYHFSPYAARSDRKLDILNIIPGIQP